MKLEGVFEAEALRILRDVPGITVDTRPGKPDRRVDAVLNFSDRREGIVVEFKQRTNAATAWQLVHYAKAFPDPPLLLISGETTARAREILADHRIAVIDGLGNVHMELPGLLLHLEGRLGQKRRAATAPPARLRGKAGVVAQALLIHIERAWQVQELAEEADVARGLAHRVLARLENEGLMTSEGAGPRRVRRVTDPAALLDLWAEEQFDQTKRTLAHLLEQTPRQLITRLGTNLAQTGIDYAITGAAGASLQAPFVTSIPVVEVWVGATISPEDLCDAAQAAPVADGENVMFLQAKDDTPLAFREHLKSLWVTNRFRLYSDLRRDRRRGREQAEHLRREVIGF